MTTSTPPVDVAPRPAPAPDLDSDLGFGAVVARESRRRLLNRDGTFNVRRDGLGYLHSLSLYHTTLTMSWPRFLGFTTLSYVALNLLFALAYLACGDGALSGIRDHSLLGRFEDAFFFSVETLATIGYGNIVPMTLASNLLVTVESLAGLIGFSLAAGLVFARVSRPTAAIIFSRHALIAPYRGGTAFEFRIANARSSQLVELEATVMVARRKPGGVERDFRQLKLERHNVIFFPLSWTIVHPIDETSPLFNVSEAELRATDAEFLILLTGTDETFSQTVHARTSYKMDEIVVGARFANIFRAAEPSDDRISIDIGRLHDIERA
ncbi:MAG: ion channel [Gemmatimonadaceae bacterium]